MSKFDPHYYTAVMSKEREILIDKDSFNAAAKVLDQINPSIGTINSFYNMMVAMTVDVGHKSAYFGTAGFYVTCFENDRGQRIAVATIMPYTVQKYIELQNYKNAERAKKVAA